MDTMIRLAFLESFKEFSALFHPDFSVFSAGIHAGEEDEITLNYSEKPGRGFVRILSIFLWSLEDS